MTSRLKQFMMTRAGFDAYTFFLLVIFFIIKSIVRITHFLPLAIPAYVVLAYAIFRFLSPNRERRQVENGRFLGLFQAASRWIRFRHTVHTDKEHRYFKCPNCHQPLRVPRGKGKIQINCRACGAQFEEKS